jgi:hypothetical protein
VANPAEFDAVESRPGGTRILDVHQRRPVIFDEHHWVARVRVVGNCATQLPGSARA